MDKDENAVVVPEILPPAKVTQRFELTLVLTQVLRLQP